MKEKNGYFNEAGFLEIAIFRSNPSKVGSANSLLGLNYRDVVSIQFKRLALIEKSKIINHMFVRIVKLSFHEENIPLFLENFESIKERIRCAPGNRLLELYQDKREQKYLFYI
jgi:hypothetical protein